MVDCISNSFQHIISYCLPKISGDVTLNAQTYTGTHQYQFV